jgi:hypothetical protein
VVSEEFEAAREIFTRTLRKYRLPENDIEKIVKRLREWGYARFVRGSTPGSISGLDTMLQSLRIFTFIVRAGSFADGRPVADLDIPGKTGVNDYGIRRGEDTRFMPDDGQILRAGDALMLFTSDVKAQLIAPLFSGPEPDPEQSPGPVHRAGESR